MIFRVSVEYAVGVFFASDIISQNDINSVIEKDEMKSYVLEEVIK